MTACLQSHRHLACGVVHLESTRRFLPVLRAQGTPHAVWTRPARHLCCREITSVDRLADKLHRSVEKSHRHAADVPAARWKKTGLRLVGSLLAGRSVRGQDGLKRRIIRCAVGPPAAHPVSRVLQRADVIVEDLIPGGPSQAIDRLPEVRHSECEILPLIPRHRQHHPFRYRRRLRCAIRDLPELNFRAISHDSPRITREIRIPNRVTDAESVV